jgi:CheY-like chemotaxis protein
MDRPVATSSIPQILLVEADRGLAELIRTSLGRRADLRVHVLGDVVSAIRFLAKRDGFIHAPTPDLILLDLELPYFAGTALLQERSRRPAWRCIPVVVFSTRDQDCLQCLALGADRHLLKPADPVGWQRLVEEVVARHLPAIGVPP